MIRALLALILMCFGAILGAAALAYYVESQPSGELCVRFGDHEANLRVGESAVYVAPDSTALYMMRLRGPLVVVPTSKVGGSE